jgi:hypothetical protein
VFSSLKPPSSSPKSPRDRKKALQVLTPPMPQKPFFRIKDAVPSLKREGFSFQRLSISMS